MYYAIEVIGYGKRTKYAVKKITKNKMIIPTNGKVYKTENDARNAAKEMNVEIMKCGNVWEIV